MVVRSVRLQPDRRVRLKADTTYGYAPLVARGRFRRSGVAVGCCWTLCFSCLSASIQSSKSAPSPQPRDKYRSYALLATSSLEIVPLLPFCFFGDGRLGLAGPVAPSLAVGIRG